MQNEDYLCDRHPQLIPEEFILSVFGSGSAATTLKYVYYLKYVHYQVRLLEIVVIPCSECDAEQML